MAAKRGVLFDVDGTLVDTNYLHVVAWADAFRIGGYQVPMWQILPLIGQGSDRLVTSLLGHPDSLVSDAHSALYAPRLYDAQPFDGAAELLRRVKSAGLQVVLATSAKSDEVALLQKAIGADEVIDEVTTSDHADSSKPAPDIVEAALRAAGLTARTAGFVGDSVWDVESAKAAGLDCVCVLTGGTDEAVLRDAGAVAVYPSVAEVLADFDSSPLARLIGD